MYLELEHNQFCKVEVVTLQGYMDYAAAAAIYEFDTPKERYEKLFEMLQTSYFLVEVPAFTVWTCALLHKVMNECISYLGPAQI